MIPNSKRGYVNSLVHRITRAIARDKLLLLIVLVLLLEESYYKTPLNILFRHVDWNTIAVILGLVMGSSLLESSGLLHKTLYSIARAVGKNHLPRVIVLFGGLLSSIIMNDAAVFVIAPIVKILAGEDKALSTRLIVVSLAAINIGSTLTPFGNPQDVIIMHHYGINLWEYTRNITPLYLPILILLYLYARRTIAYPSIIPGIQVAKRPAILGTISIITAVFSSFLRCWWPSLIVSVIVYLLGSRYISLTDLTIVPIIAGIYMILVPIRGEAITINNAIITYIAGFLLSMLLSNVPATIVLLGAPWIPLHLAVNLAGVIHPYSSLANLIGLRLSRTSWRDYTVQSIILGMSLFIYGFAIVSYLNAMNLANP